MESCSTIFLEWVSIHCFQVELELKVLVFVEVGKPENRPSENPRNRDKNKQHTQPTYGVNSGIRIRATQVGGERSHNCVIPAPPFS